MQRPVATPSSAVDVAASRTTSVPRANVFGFEFDQLDEAGVVDHVFGELERGRGGWMITPNLHILRQAARDDEVADLVRRAPLVVMDGAPVEWAGRISRQTKVERAPGSTVFWTLCEAAARRGRSVLLMGGRAGSAELAAANLAELHPGINVGWHFPPFGFESDRRAVDDIRDAVRRHADGLVFVGLGCPKQERLMQDLSREFPNTWFFGVGAAIDFASGQVRRAPAWMQRSGLEWAHRLGTEPRRLARRYLVEDLPFAGRLLGWAVAERFSGSQEPPAGEEASDWEQMLAHARVDIEEGSSIAARATLRSIAESHTAAERTRAGALDALVQLMMSSGQYQECVPLLQQRLVLAFDRAEERVLAQMRLGRLMMECGDLLPALEVAGSAVRESESTGMTGTPEGVRLRVTFADLLRTRGDIISAELQVGLALAAARRLGDPQASGSAMWNAALISAEQGRFAEAIALTTSAREQFDAVGDRLASSLVAVAAASIQIDSRTGDLSALQDGVHEALAVIAELGSPAQEGMAFVQLARLRLLQGDTTAAFGLIQGALAEFGDTNRIDTAIALGVKAQILAAMGDAQEANGVAAHAAQEFRSAGAERSAGAVWAALAAVGQGTAERGSAAAAGGAVPAPRERPATVESREGV